MNRNAIALPAPPATGQTFPLADGDVGTSDTVRRMCELVNEGARDPEINRAALAIVHGARVPQFDFAGERRAIYEWKRRSIRFFRDIEGKETLRSARETLHVRGGDCDCQTILTCALLKTIGQLVRIVTISTHPEAPDVFSHVFPEVRDERGRWISLDTARKRPRFGLGPNHWFRRRIWDTDDGSYQDAHAPEASAAAASRAVFAGLGCPQPQMGLAYYGGNPRNHMGAFNARQRYLRGLARLGRLHGLGQSDLTDVLTALPSIEVGTSDIVAASRAAPTNIVASNLTPQAQSLISDSGSISSGTLWLLGGGALLLFLLMRGRS